jgi:hypothetical protein
MAEWHKHMNLAFGYSHVSVFISSLFLPFLIFQSRGYTKAKLAYGLYGALLLVGLIGGTLSVVSHIQLEDGIINHDAVAWGSFASCLATLLLGAGTFFYLWYQTGLRAPFQNQLFPYILFATFVALGMMVWMYAHGKVYFERHQKTLSEEGIDSSFRFSNDNLAPTTGAMPEYWSSDFENFTVYHLQWHHLGGYFCLLTLFMIAVLMKLHCE